MEFSPVAERVEGPLMGPNPFGIILEALLAFPGVILNINGPPLDDTNLSGPKFELQADKNNEKKSNKNLLLFINIYT
jgi:hypothetical protein